METPEKQVMDNDSLQYIAAFEKISHVKVRDFYIHNERLIYIINEGDLLRALGKDGANVKLLSSKLGKRIKVAEYNPDVKLFIRNLIHPLRVAKTDLNTPDEGVITLSDADVKTKGLIIGAKAQNLRFYERVVQKYFPEVKEIKVV